MNEPGPALRAHFAALQADQDTAYPAAAPAQAAPDRGRTEEAEGPRVAGDMARVREGAEQEALRGDQDPTKQTTTSSRGLAVEAQPDRIDGRIRAGALLRWGFFVGIGVAVAVIGADAMYSIRSMLIRILVALFIAVSLDPAVRWLTRHGMRRNFAVTVILLLFALVTAGFFFSIIPPLVQQGQSLAHSLPADLHHLESGPLGGLAKRFNLNARLQQLGATLPATASSSLLGITSRVFSDAISFLTVFVLTIYFMAELPGLRRGLPRLFPVDRRERYAAMSDLVIDKVGDYMIGRLAIAAIAGVSAFVVLLLLGVGYALALAILIAFLDLIPLIGHPIGGAVAVIVALFTTSLWPGVVLVAVFFILYSQVEDYVIVPRVLRTSMDISSTSVLLAALIGASVLGIVGTLMAIPIAAAVKAILMQQIDAHEAAVAAKVYRRRFLRPRRFPVATGNASTKDTRKDAD